MFQVESDYPACFSPTANRGRGREVGGGGGAGGRLWLPWQQVLQAATAERMDGWMMDQTADGAERSCCSQPEPSRRGSSSASVREAGDEICIFLYIHTHAHTRQASSFAFKVMCLSTLAAGREDPVADDRESAHVG